MGERESVWGLQARVAGSVKRFEELGSLFEERLSSGDLRGAQACLGQMEAELDSLRELVDVVRSGRAPR